MPYYDFGKGKKPGNGRTNEMYFMHVRPGANSMPPNVLTIISYETC